MPHLEEKKEGEMNKRDGTSISTILKFLGLFIPVVAAAVLMIHFSYKNRNETAQQQISLHKAELEITHNTIDNFDKTRANDRAAIVALEYTVEIKDKEIQRKEALFQQQEDLKRIQGESLAIKSQDIADKIKEINFLKRKIQEGETEIETLRVHLKTIQASLEKEEYARVTCEKERIENQ